jgi:hypothetical protein
MEALFQAPEIILEVQRKRNNKKITKKKKLFKLQNFFLFFIF